MVTQNANKITRACVSHHSHTANTLSNLPHHSLRLPYLSSHPPVSFPLLPRYPLRSTHAPLRLALSYPLLSSSWLCLWLKNAIRTYNTREKRCPYLPNDFVLCQLSALANVFQFRKFGESEFPHFARHTNSVCPQSRCEKVLLCPVGHAQAVTLTFTSKGGGAQPLVHPLTFSHSHQRSMCTYHLPLPFPLSTFCLQ